MTSTFKRLLSEYEDAVKEVLHEIKRVKKTGEDDEATLYGASSLEKSRFCVLSEQSLMLLLEHHR